MVCLIALLSNKLLTEEHFFGDNLFGCLFPDNEIPNDMKPENSFKTVVLTCSGYFKPM